MKDSSVLILAAIYQLDTDQEICAQFTDDTCTQLETLIGYHQIHKTWVALRVVSDTIFIAASTFDDVYEILERS